MANEKQDKKKSTGVEPLPVKETAKENKEQLNKEIISQMFGELFPEKTLQELEELGEEKVGFMLMEKLKDAFLNSNAQLIHTKNMLGIFDENNPIIQAIQANEKIIILIDILEHARNQAE